MGPGSIFFRDSSCLERGTLSVAADRRVMRSHFFWGYDDSVVTQTLGPSASRCWLLSDSSGRFLSTHVFQKTNSLKKRNPGCLVLLFALLIIWHTREEYANHKLYTHWILRKWLLLYNQEINHCQSPSCLSLNTSTLSPLRVTSGPDFYDCISLKHPIIIGQKWFNRGTFT